MKLAFTDPTIRNLKLPEKGATVYWDESLSGFGIRVSQGGTKTWVVLDPRSRVRTQETIGRYPVVSLKSARTEAKTRLSENYLTKTQKSRAEASKALSQYLDHIKANRRPRTHQDYSYYLDKFPWPRKLADVSPDDLRKHFDRYKPTEKTHATVIFKAFFNWAYQQSYVETSPLARVKAKPYRKRSTTLSSEQLKRVWDACPANNFGRLVRLLITTGQRRGEILALDSKKWVKDESLTIPAEIAKNGKAHTIPIGKLTLQNIGPTAWKGLSKSKAKLDKDSGVDGYILHDLRRTFRTMWAELGISREVSERYINHVSGTQSGVEGIYDRHHYYPEMKAAVDKWEAHLNTILRIG